MPQNYAQRVGERLRSVASRSACRCRRSRRPRPGVQGVGARRLRARRAGDLGAPAPAAGPLLQRARRPAPAPRPGPTPEAAPAATIIDLTDYRRTPGRQRPMHGHDRPHQARDVVGARRRHAHPVPRDDPGAAQDFNGRVLTIRRDDLRAIACILDDRRPTRCRRPARRAGPTSLSALTRLDATPAFGVYVHVPFCRRRCDYCAFATWTDRAPPDRRLPRRVSHRHRADDVAGMPAATSVFFGGGTPSLVPRRRAGARCSTRSRAVAGRRGDGRVQPRHVDRTSCWPPTAAAASTGCRSACSRWCRTCSPRSGRTHDPANVERAVARPARPGSTSFNLDLIYGAAGESLDDWRRTLDEVLALDPPHVSAYALTVEAGTPLAADPARHPDDDDQADKYSLADELLAAAGLGWLRDLQLGPPRPRVPAQPPLLGAGRLPRLRLRRPLAPRRPALVERAHARALHRRRRGGDRPRRRRGARRRDPPRSRACSSRCARVGGVEAAALPPTPELDGSSRRRRRRARPHRRRAAARQRGGAAAGRAGLTGAEPARSASAGVKDVGGGVGSSICWPGKIRLALPARASRPALRRITACQ